MFLHFVLFPYPCYLPLIISCLNLFLNLSASCNDVYNTYRRQPPMLRTKCKRPDMTFRVRADPTLACGSAFISCLFWPHPGCFNSAILNLGSMTGFLPTRSLWLVRRPVNLKFRAQLVMHTFAHVCSCRHSPQVAFTGSCVPKKSAH